MSFSFSLTLHSIIHSHLNWYWSQSTICGIYQRRNVLFLLRISKKCQASFSSFVRNYYNFTTIRAGIITILRLFQLILILMRFHGCYQRHEEKLAEECVKLLVSLRFGRNIRKILFFWFILFKKKKKFREPELQIISNF